MNWFDILKNQIASTEGKQFQLDFNKPMIEDDDCKKTLMRIAKKISNINSIEGYPYIKNVRQKNEFKIFSEEDVEFRSFLETSYVRLNSGGSYLKDVPEEVCCKAIELYKSLADGSADQIFLPGKRPLAANPAYYVYAGKNVNDEKEKYARYLSFIEIHQGSGPDGNFRNWAIEILCLTGPKQNKEKSEETCRKLTRELFVL
jgi:hypothetical protein